MPSDSDSNAPGRHARIVFDGVDQFRGLLAPDGTLLDANRAARALIGVRQEQVTGRPFPATPWFTDPTDREALQAALVEAARGHKACLGVRHPGTDGLLVEVELTLSPVLGEGRVTYIIARGRPLSDQRRVERERDAAARRLAGILDIAADAIVSMDADHRIRLFNQGAEATFGYRAQDVIGERIEMLLPGAARELHTKHVEGFAAGGESARFMNRRQTISGRRKSGESFPAEATISRLDVNGEIAFTAVLRDITERRHAENELERSRQFTEAILESVVEGIFGLDREGRVAFANSAALQLLGYSNEELVDRDLHSIIHHRRADGTPYPHSECPVHASLEDDRVRRCDSDVYWRANGTSLPVEFTVTPFHIEGRVEGAVVVFRDISQRKRDEARLRELSQVDELTGLLNRRGFVARADQAIAQARRSGARCTLLFIDLDFFKPINDQYGHLAGDEALREVAHILRSAFRESDVLARYGGDEFVVLATGTDDASAVGKIRERLRARVDARNADPASLFPLSMSVGGTLIDPAGPAALDELLRQADAALYEEKRRRPGAR